MNFDIHIIIKNIKQEGGQGRALCRPENLKNWEGNAHNMLKTVDLDDISLWSQAKYYIVKRAQNCSVFSIKFFLEFHQRLD
jgi:hypothetical protein